MGGNLFDMEGSRKEERIGCISISSGQKTEEDEEQERKQAITTKCQSIGWITILSLTVTNVLVL
jgi:hypothetical protein